jgi:hypothetical protein
MSSGNKKHPCPDCIHCQWCGNDRCRMCLGHSGAFGKKLSMREQIELYESLNDKGRKMLDEKP